MTEGKDARDTVSFRNLSPRFITLLVLAGDAALTSLQWRRAPRTAVREFVVSEEARLYKEFDTGTIAGGEEAPLGL